MNITRRKLLGCLVALPFVKLFWNYLKPDYVVNNARFEGVSMSSSRIDDHGIQSGFITYNTDKGDFLVTYNNRKSYYNGKRVEVVFDIFKSLQNKENFYIKYV